MSTTMKTPGVYIQELDAFGNAVIPVPTAVPVFIGYTEQTTYNGSTVINKPVRISSLNEFLMIFGSSAPKIQYAITSTILPERIADLQTIVDNAQKAKDQADGIVTSNTDPNATPPKLPTRDQTDAAAAAAKELTVAQEALAKAQADPNINALLEAQAKLAKAKSTAAAETVVDADGKMAAAIKAEQTELDNIAQSADFSSDGIACSLKRTNVHYRMYSSLKFFYENGGGDCFILSIGAYDYTKDALTDTTDFINAIRLLKKEVEPTLLVIPDVVEIQDPTADTSSTTYLQDKYANAYSLQNEMINHCGEMQNRVAILDIPAGYYEQDPGKTTSIEQFRNSVMPLDPKFKSYAAAYYPWLHTTVYQSTDISDTNIHPASYNQVVELLNVEFTDDRSSLKNKLGETISAFTAEQKMTLSEADLILNNLSKSYRQLMAAIRKKMNLLAPSAAMAGIYTTADHNEGVWVAPANVGVQSVVAPAINIDHTAQEDLNVPVDGKSICAIRAFPGRGNLVWGARTLDGNSNDWRYINVRRLMIYVEQSVKEAAKAYVFAPNDTSTWANVKSMISKFLQDLWKQGGLVGPKPADAFSVNVGLGSTMTSKDISLGLMRVSVKVAVSHPAEFIEITLQQEMQKG
jgi:phage tail sheath protein FI